MIFALHAVRSWSIGIIEAGTRDAPNAINYMDLARNVEKSLSVLTEGGMCTAHKKELRIRKNCAMRVLSCTAFLYVSDLWMLEIK